MFADPLRVVFIKVSARKNCVVYQSHRRSRDVQIALRFYGVRYERNWSNSKDPTDVERIVTFPGIG